MVACKVVEHLSKLECLITATTPRQQWWSRGSECLAGPERGGIKSRGSPLPEFESSPVQLPGGKPSGKPESPRPHLQNGASNSYFPWKFKLAPAEALCRAKHSTIPGVILTHPTANVLSTFILQHYGIECCFSWVLKTYHFEKSHVLRNGGYSPLRSRALQPASLTLDISLG